MIVDDATSFSLWLIAPDVVKKRYPETTTKFLLQIAGANLAFTAIARSY